MVVRDNTEQDRATGMAVLNAIGENLDLDEVATLLGQMAARSPAPPDAAAAALPEGEAQLLVAHSGLSDSAQANLERTLAHPARTSAEAAAVTAGSMAALLESTYPTAEFAQLTGRDPSSISRAAAAGRLYAVRVGGKLRFPAWQVHAGQLLPGLPAVVAMIGPGVHPASVEAAMTTERDDLDGLTGIAWLAGGGDPEPVARLLDALDRW